MRGRTRRQYREIAKNTRACRRARGMGHLSLATERNIDMRIITYGTVGENQKTRRPCDTDCEGEERGRQRASVELYECFQTQTAPPVQSCQPVPTFLEGHGGARCL